MGLEILRFDGDVDEELICAICGGVLEDAVQAPSCEHAFCRLCIEQWLRQQSNCPVDRRSVNISELSPVPRILRNLLSRLQIHCDNQSSGCYAVVRLDALERHLSICEFNPKRPVPCEKGCGMILPKDNMSEHNCVRDLRVIVDSQEKRLEELHQNLVDQQMIVRSQSRDIRALKEAVRSLSGSQQFSFSIDLSPAGTEESEADIRAWSASLPVARINRWGGIISTPDPVLQAVIRRALSQTGCSTGLLMDLMDRVHERGWPPGLQNLEIRQRNRIHFERSVCRRVPGKQAVVVLACENPSLPPELTVHPGVILIFAHGVE